MPSVFENWPKKSDEELLKDVLESPSDTDAYKKAKLLIETRNAQSIRRATWAIVLLTAVLALFSILDWLKEDPVPSPPRDSMLPVGEGSSPGR
ncbi:hypothetical protein MYX82_12550 [Acidobacteria bacterium AH-259-D05]|nr:hypothetical protein [Acidobacteria bacterium AH-259-D05]